VSQFRSDRDPEALALLDHYMARKMAKMDYANRMENLRIKQFGKPESNTLVV
jgi:hypothetical protein